MASPAQQQTFQRKLLYLGSVVVLLLGSLLWRRHVVEAKAQDMALLDQSHGDVEVLGSAVRLGLSGSRGLVTCALWYTAYEKQKKNQWNELEMIVRTLTKLQPHFITPWLCQSWNLAYNVSVESDRPGDKYFYITRGIQLLADGERQNRYNPELRREMGFYHHHKICASDETNVLRSIFQLSCIPPADREPENFGYVEGKLDWEIKWPEFVAFCKAHPHLVRRLHSPPLPYDRRREHDKFRCKNAQEVILFLAEHRNVPSLYVEKEENAKDFEQKNFKPKELERFPILPPERDNMFEPIRGMREWTQEELVRQATIPDDFDGDTVARAWYGYAQEALPLPGKLPGENAPIKDRLREHVPRHMSQIIFRSHPPLAQTFVAKRLQEEGWYDGEGFVPEDWFKASAGAPERYQRGGVKVGEKTEWWSQLAWAKAYSMWFKFGTDNHLRLDPLELDHLKWEAARARKAFNLREGEVPKEMDEDLFTEEQKKAVDAIIFLQHFHTARFHANFQHHLSRATVEADKKTILARKLFYEAEQARLARQAPLEALKKYEQREALEAWSEVLEQNEEFRTDGDTQEETYETELKYLRAYRKVHGERLAQNLALETFLGQAAAPAPLGADWALLSLYSRDKLLPELTLVGPFEKDSQGRPLIDEEVKTQVLRRRDVRQAGADRPQQTNPQPGQ